MILLHVTNDSKEQVPLKAGFNSGSTFKMQVKFSHANISSDVSKRQGVWAAVQSSDLNQGSIDCELIQEDVNLFILKWDAGFLTMLSKYI